jgi:uncharacterized protein
MPSELFEESISVQSPPTACWDLLLDVARVASWVTVVESVTERESLKSYDVILKDKFGPFRLLADMAVEVTDVNDGTSISLKGSGKDRQISTTLIVDATLVLRPEGEGTTLTVKGSYGVFGSVASMGAGTVKKKASAIVDQFFSAARTELDAVPPA